MFPLFFILNYHFKLKRAVFTCWLLPPIITSKSPKFGYIVEIIVVEVQQFGVILKETVLLSPALRKIFEAFQLFHRAGNASHQVADIQLYHFRTLPLTGIGHCNYSGYRTVYGPLQERSK